jgi:CTP synthase
MRGETVQVVKFDPYLNRTASLLSPYQHGEVFLCDDGSETDLDLGHYERITGIEVSSQNIWTSGRLYSEVFEEEEHGKYMGQTVQIMPHLTNKILEKLQMLGQNCDIVVAEIGGTVGDIESDLFFEAVAQLRHRLGERQCMIAHVAPILWINTIKEHKTKPLQNSVRELKQRGLHPDMLLCRVDREISPKILDKVSHMTGVPREAVFEAPDVQSIYEVPITFYDRHIDDFIADRFHLKRNGIRIHHWRGLVERYIKSDMPEVNIGIVGKYATMEDAYLSLKEAIIHAGVEKERRINIHWIEAEKLEEFSTLRGVGKFFEGIDGVIIPGGFDNRGIKGKIRAIQYAREKKIPLLGICLGLQCAVIEFAQHECGLDKANSVEFAKEGEEIVPVIHWVPGLEHIRKKNGTLRLGAFECHLTKGSLANSLYKKRSISERHRHRYEVNGEYADLFAQKGFHVSGLNPGAGLIEVMELDKKHHPYFICCQFHPEFKSRLGNAHPLFVGLIEAAVNEKEGQVEQVGLDEPAATAAA